MMRLRLPGKENVVQLLTLYCIACVRIRWLGEVWNEITSCFPCYESAMEDKVHCCLLSDIC
jgi:hypothetical protein